MPLTKNLTTPLGATKSVQDTGPLIDPALNTIAGVSSIAGAIEQGIGKVQQAKRQNEAAGRARRSSEIAETKFVHYMEDREKANQLDAFKDEAERGLMKLNSVQRGINQGVLPKEKLDIETETFATSILQKFPGFDAELGQFMQGRGYEHLLFQATIDAQDQHVSEREVQQKMVTDAAQEAFTSGLADANTPVHEAAAIGQKVMAHKKQMEDLKLRREIVKTNAEINQTQRETMLAAAEREQMKITGESLNILSGSVVSNIVTKISSATDQQSFNELVKQVPTFQAQLEQQRVELKRSSNGSKDSWALIDSEIDRSQALITEMISGDYSAAKSMADRISNAQANAKLNLFETLPFMAELEALPTSMTDPIYTKLGVHFMGDEKWTNGIADYLAGVKTQDAEAYSKLKKNREERPSLESLPLKEARDVLQSDLYIQDEAVKKVLSPQTPKEQRDTYSSELLDAQHYLLPAYRRALTEGSKGDMRDAKAGLERIATPWIAQALEKAMENPLLKEEASMVMKETRNEVRRTVEKVRTNAADSTFMEAGTANVWKTEYNPDLMRYEAVFDEEKARRNIETNARLSRTGQLVATPEQILAARNRGVTDRVRDKVDILNRSMDFLSRTKHHDPSIRQNVTEKEFLEAYATNDFSKIAEGNPAELAVVEDIADVDTKPAAQRGLAMTSAYRVSEPSLVPTIDAAARKTALPPALLHAMADQESGGLKLDERTSVVNSKGAKGVFQIRKPAAQDMGYDWDELDDPVKNAEAGAKYLAHQLKNFDGDVEDALMAYNAGPGRIRNWIEEGRPIIEGRSWQNESFPYVEKILKRLEETQTEEQQEQGVQE